MDEKMQDEDLVKADLRNHERLVSERSPWESLYREIDEMFPGGAGGFCSEGGALGCRTAAFRRARPRRRA